MPNAADYSVIRGIMSFAGQDIARAMHLRHDSLGTLRMMFLFHRLRRIQRLSFCGVLIAFVVQILAWSVMPVSAKGIPADEGWLVICTSDGFKRIPLADAGITPVPLHNDNHAPAILVEHCDLCVFAHGLGLGPTPILFAEQIQQLAVVRWWTAGSPVLDTTHTPQQPRAPPVFA